MSRINNRLTHMSIAAMTVAGMAAVSAAGAQEWCEGMQDFGRSAGDPRPDGVPDLLLRNGKTGEIRIVFMHEGIDRALTHADLNAEGGVYYGPGTIGEIQVTATGEGFVATGDAGQVLVDDWGTGGSGLEAEFSVNGSITAIDVVDGGAGYHDNGIGYFDIDEEGTGGSGLDVFYETIDGAPDQVYRLEVTDGGSGYEPGATLAVLNADILGHPGDPLVGQAYVDAEGVIHAIDLVARGTGFTETPTPILFPAPEQGSGAEFQAWRGTSIYRVWFTPGNPDAGGNGYTSDPILTPQTPGSGFAYEMTREGGIHEVTVINPGSGYAVPPVIELVSDTGSGADIVPVLWEDMDPTTRPPSNQTGSVQVADQGGTPLLLPGRKWKGYQGDLDGDRDLDLFWRADWTARDVTPMEIWFMDGAVVDEVVTLDSPGEDWWPWALINLDGDDDDDVAYWNEATGQLAVFGIDRDAPDHIDADQVWFPEPMGWRWIPGTVVPGEAGSNDRVFWRHRGPVYFALADYAELDPSVLVSLDDVVWEHNGRTVYPAWDVTPAWAGNLNGDGRHCDVLMRCRDSGMYQIWQMDDDTLHSRSMIMWNGDRPISPKTHSRGMTTYGPSGNILLAFGNGTVATMRPTTDVYSVGQPSTIELTSLTTLIDQYAQAGDAETAETLMTSIRATLTATPTLAVYLLDAGNATDLIGELDHPAQDEILLHVEVLTRGDFDVDASTNQMDALIRVSPEGVVTSATPKLMPESTSAGGGSSGGGSGDGSGDGSGGTPGGDGGGDSGSGPGGGDGGGGDGSDDGSGGGGGGGLPDNFDPNDPSTWPPGVDDFEELLEWLIENGQSLG